MKQRLIVVVIVLSFISCESAKDVTYQVGSFTFRRSATVCAPHVTHKAGQLVFEGVEAPTGGTFKVNVAKAAYTQQVQQYLTEQLQAYNSLLNATCHTLGLLDRRKDTTAQQIIDYSARRDDLLKDLLGVGLRLQAAGSENEALAILNASKANPASGVSVQTVPTGTSTPMTAAPAAPPAPQQVPQQSAPQQAPRTGAPAAPVDPRAGCWIRIWEDASFDAGDANDIILGPGSWATMHNLPNALKQDWGDNIDSFRVGPNARVTVWKDQNYEGGSTVLEPGSERSNMADWGDAIDSMRIDCVP